MASQLASIFDKKRSRPLPALKTGANDVFIDADRMLLNAVLADDPLSIRKARLLGADLNVRIDSPQSKRDTYLHIAARVGAAKSADALLDMNIDSMAVNGRGDRAAHVAVDVQARGVARVFLKHDVDLLTPNLRGEAPRAKAQQFAPLIFEDIVMHEALRDQPAGAAAKTSRFMN
jgi:hypothetical protein